MIFKKKWFRFISTTKFNEVALYCTCIMSRSCDERRRHFYRTVGINDWIGLALIGETCWPVLMSIDVKWDIRQTSVNGYSISALLFGGLSLDRLKATAAVIARLRRVVICVCGSLFVCSLSVCRRVQYL